LSTFGAPLQIGPDTPSEKTRVLRSGTGGKP